MYYKPLLKMALKEFYGILPILYEWMERSDTLTLGTSNFSSL